MRPPPPPSDPETALDITHVITEAEVKRYIALAKDRMLDAIESTIFMCGMAPVDPDDPCYDIFKCDPALDCDTHIESEYYASKIKVQDIPLCCHCAGTSQSPIAVHTHLMAQNGGLYSIVLPMCEDCIAIGRHIIVRGARQKAQEKMAQMDAKRARDVARLEKEAGANNAQALEVDAQASASARVGSSASSQPKRSRKRKVPEK